MNRRDLLKSAPALGAALTLPAAAPAKQARLRPALCAYSFRQALSKKTMSYEDLVRLAAELEMDGLDTTAYWFPNTSNEFLLPFKRLAYKLSVAIYSIAVRTEMTQPTRELQDKELAELSKWVDVAERLGASHVRVFGGKIPKGATEEQAAGWVVEVLKRAAEYSGKKGIILGLENHGGVTEKSETILRMIKQVDSPWVGVNLDTGNFVQDAYAQIQRCIPYAVNFQVKSEIRGEGGRREPSDWDRILRMAAEAGYRGYLALEYEAAEDPATAAPRLLRRLRELTRKYSA